MTIDKDKRGIKGEIEVCAHRVSYSYWNAENEINDEVAAEMEEHAEDRAKECITQGYHSGELNFYRAEPEEEVRGWWEIRRD